MPRRTSVPKLASSLKFAKAMRSRCCASATPAPATAAIHINPAFVTVRLEIKPSNRRITSRYGLDLLDLGGRTALAEMRPCCLHDIANPQSILLEQVLPASGLGKHVVEADPAQRHADARFRERFGHRRPKPSHDRMVFSADDEARGAPLAQNCLGIERLVDRGGDNRGAEAR